MFKVKLHSDLYNANRVASEQQVHKEKEILDTQSRIQQLKKLKSDLKWKEKRGMKSKEIEQKKNDEKEYREYQEELRKMVIGLIEQQLQQDKKYKLERNFNQLQESKIDNMRSLLQQKLNTLDEMKANLDESEWKKLKDNEKKEEKRLIHQEFLKKLEEEKVFKQLLYAAEKKIEQEEMKKRRDEALRTKHNKLLKEQQELEAELNMLQQMYED